MNHPDDYNGLIDWELYGPKDPEITQLVYQLAYGKNLRLMEIEDLIKNALRERLAESSTSRE
ncbi:MAG: hypothetical protein AAAC48_22620 [Phyllobacterium sp.]|jgi:hypothetical protein|uniref:hypothetical protein n=1 Tax=Phyllobacterium sp. TaxID=1871046 RepID=UPI0030F18BF8